MCDVAMARVASSVSGSNESFTTDTRLSTSWLSSGTPTRSARKIASKRARSAVRAQFDDVVEVERAASGVSG